MTHRPKTKEEAIRRFILEKSEKVFAANGFEKTSMEMVAQECGLSKPTLYNYFIGKKELFQALHTQIHEVTFAEVRRILQQQKSVLQLLAEVFDVTTAMILQKRPLFQVFLNTTAILYQDALHNHIEMHQRQERETILHILDPLQREVRPDVAARFSIHEVALAVHKLFEGMVSEVILQPDTPVERMRMLLLHLVESGFLKPSR